MNPTPQTAILPEHMTACLVIEADAVPGATASLLAACRRSQDVLQQYRQQHPQAQLGLAIGFGADLWRQIGPAGSGTELKPFRPLGNGLAPATQHDVAIHIQSLNHGANMLLALALLAEFGTSLQVADETHGFRLPEDRGYDGFVDGTENPQGDDRATIGVIAAPAADAGGSYLLLQKYRHDLARWQRLSDAQQANVIGRTKQDDEELPSEQRLPASHLGRVDLKENGVGLKILRQSLPYGHASGEHGLLFIAYCARLYNIEQQLLSMFGERDGKTDLLLSKISTAISGSYYFVPASQQLAALGAD